MTISSILIEQVHEVLSNCDSITKLEESIEPSSSQSGDKLSRRWNFQFLLAEKIDAYLCIDEDFPLSSPTIFIDEKYYCRWPHVEERGKLCLFEQSTVFDQSNIEGVIFEWIKQACKLLTKSINGSNTKDFRDEIQSYWLRCAENEYAGTVVSILQHPFTTRVVTVCFENNIILLADDEEQAKCWFSNYSNSKKSQNLNCFKSVLIDIGDNIITPCKYPKTGDELLNLIKPLGIDIQDEMQIAVEKRSSFFIFVMNVVAKSSDCLIATVQPWPCNKSKIRNGFRTEGAIPLRILIKRLFTQKLENTNLERADPIWIHGRGKNPEVEELCKKNITIIGCGSIGSSVAELLLKSGVGEMNLIDFDTLSSANVSRHVLGMRSLNKSKSSELCSKFKQDYPHCQIRSWQNEWQKVEEVEKVLGASDLILELTANKYSYQKLNEWHRNENKRRIPIIYGYTENNATAGLCLTIANKGGCIECALDKFGKYKFKITQWPPNQTHHEPGCGAEFVSYGAIELQQTTSLISKKAIDVLLRRPTHSEMKCWVADKNTVFALGGDWAKEWKSHNKFRDEGCLIFSQPIKKDCKLCP